MTKKQTQSLLLKQLTEPNGTHQSLHKAPTKTTTKPKPRLKKKKRNDESIVRKMSSKVEVPPSPPRVVDIGINLTHGSFKKHWRNVVQRAIDRGVDRILLTGTSIKRSKESLALAHQWLEETGCPNLFVTIGIHPHDAKTWNNKTKQEMIKLLKHPLAVAVGECGLDYNRNFSTKRDQIHAFREQVKLAYELNMPLFLHEREAHDDLIKVFEELKVSSPSSNEALPAVPAVIHCFTGTEEEATTYVCQGFYIAFTGTICKKERGAPLRDLLPAIPPERLMVETDAPFMGFNKSRRNSEPEDCTDVARKLGDTIGISHDQICQMTTNNAVDFFRLDDIALPEEK